MSIKIGNTELKHGLFLAPMAGFTDYSFRAICREHGVEYTVSEMVSAKALCYEQISKKNSDDAYKTATLCRLDGDELPMAIQLFGSEPQYVAEAARMIEARSYKKCTASAVPTAIDINMGCPMHKIVGNGEGSALMKNPALAAEMAKMLEDAGASLICVHARTREQMYNPGIDLSIIERVKNAVTIPVVGNGDINSAQDAVNMIEKTGCDGVMIGRGAIGNPWIFEEISAYLDGREYIPPSLKERLEACVKHVKMICDDKGEITGGAEIKKHAVMYIKGVRSAASVRDAIMKSHSTAEIEEIIKGLIEE